MTMTGIVHVSWHEIVAIYVARDSKSGADLFIKDLEKLKEAVKSLSLHYQRGLSKPVLHCFRTNRLGRLLILCDDAGIKSSDILQTWERMEFDQVRTTHIDLVRQRHAQGDIKFAAVCDYLQAMMLIMPLNMARQIEQLCQNISYWLRHPSTDYIEEQASKRRREAQHQALRSEEMRRQFKIKRAVPCDIKQEAAAPKTPQQTVMPRQWVDGKLGSNAQQDACFDMIIQTMRQLVESYRSPLCYLGRVFKQDAHESVKVSDNKVILVPKCLESFICTIFNDHFPSGLNLSLSVCYLSIDSHHLKTVAARQLYAQLQACLVSYLLLRHHDTYQLDEKLAVMLQPEADNYPNCYIQNWEQMTRLLINLALRCPGVVFKDPRQPSETYKAFLSLVRDRTPAMVAIKQL